MNQLENKNGLVLDIENLSVRFATEDGVVNAVNGLDLRIEKGKAIGLVGETGAGKTTTCLLYTSPRPRDSCASRMPSSA